MVKPRLLITMGDVAGIGPEIIARSWPQLSLMADPVVVGDAAWMQRALTEVGSHGKVQRVESLADARPSDDSVTCLQATSVRLGDVQVGRVSAAAGRASYEFLCRAIDETLAGQAHGIVTAPLHKEGLHAAGVKHPGHTEILAERTGASEFAMVLYGEGIAVAHVTLHMALSDVFARITRQSVVEKIHLVHEMLPRLELQSKIGVCALNPHAGDGGLFGDEEKKIIAPAVMECRNRGISVDGPWPSDTLFVRAAQGEFNGVVAMYHDQGHIAMKLRCGKRAVNISAGLPIIRTSVSHGTAYDIAGQGLADPSSMIAAADAACRLIRNSS